VRHPRQAAAEEVSDIVQSHFCGTSAQAILKNLGWRFCTMANLVYGLNQSLEGYVDLLEFRPNLALFRHFIEHVRDLTGIVYGRRMYEVMRYWDEDRADWVAEERDFAAAWQSRPKWVVSRSLKSAGPNATLVEGDIEAVIRGLKAQPFGEIDVAGPDLAGSLTNLGVIDEYRLYLHPIVLGRGKPFFSGPRPPLRLVASDLVAGDVIRLAVRSRLIARLARRTAPTRRVRFRSRPGIPACAPIFPQSSRTKEPFRDVAKPTLVQRPFQHPDENTPAAEVAYRWLRPYRRLLGER
jgi:dihydrofolate reductase